MPFGTGRQSPISVFQLALDQLSLRQLLFLQLIHDLREIGCSDLARVFHSDSPGKVLNCLRILEVLGLVMERNELWYPTWLGDGAINWRQQLLCAEELKVEPIPVPYVGENGQQLGPLCNRYRPTLFAPGYCWCCRPRHEHVGEYIKAAEELVRRQSS